MATSKAKIAAAAVNGFKGAGDLARDAVLTRSTPGGYDPVTETTTAPTTLTTSGQALFNQRSHPFGGRLGSMVVEPSDDTAFMRGFEFAPEPGDEILIDGRDYTVRNSDDIMRAGALFLVVLA